MKVGPKVSIGMPVYNGEKTLAKAIESILNQDYTNIEIIISDNCSTDSTFAICQKYRKEDARIQYTRFDKNRGTIANFNNVFNLSSGDFFMWASHDDFHEPSFISECIRSFANNPEAALCAPKMKGIISPKATHHWIGDLSTFKDKSSVVGRYFETLQHFPAVAIYGLYRSSMIRKTSLLPNGVGADLLFIQNLSLYGSFIQSDQVIFTYYGREKWNTVDQDYAVFYGERKKPWFYSPFLIVFFNQIKIVVNCHLAMRTKFGLIGVLVYFQAGQFILKVTLKIIKYIIPKKIGMSLATKIYWRFIHSPNVKVDMNNEYVDRIIRPIVGLRI
jgi:glycosyltransferase involved in cell wall biosynthesis